MLCDAQQRHQHHELGALRQHQHHNTERAVLRKRRLLPSRRALPLHALGERRVRVLRSGLHGPHVEGHSGVRAPVRRPRAARRSVERDVQPLELLRRQRGQRQPAVRGAHRRDLQRAGALRPADVLRRRRRRHARRHALRDGARTRGPLGWRGRGHRRRVRHRGRGGARRAGVHGVAAAAGGAWAGRRRRPLQVRRR